MSYSLIDTHCHLDIIEKEGLPIEQTLKASIDIGVKEILQIGIDDISIKATTTEKMGFVGREEGLVAYATCLLAAK